MGIGMGKREHDRLTPADIKRAKRPIEKPEMLADGLGLYLQLRVPNGRSWIFRFKRDGHPYDLGIGPLHTIGLAQARAKAKRYREMLLDGVNPLEQRREARARRKLEAAKQVTFRDAADAYMAAKSAEWRNPIHQQQWTQSLRDYVFPLLGDLSVSAIDTGLVMQVLEQEVAIKGGQAPFWQARTETANRTRARIERVLDYAKSRGFREGANPATWRGHIAHMLPRR